VREESNKSTAMVQSQKLHTRVSLRALPLTGFKCEVMMMMMMMAKFEDFCLLSFADSTSVCRN
jgi:hypothetical protein